MQNDPSFVRRFRAQEAAIGKTQAIERPFSRVRARLIGNAFTLTTGVNAAVPFNGELYDTDTCHDNAVNNTRLVCNTPGVYHIGANARFASNVTGYRQIFIRHQPTGFALASVLLSPVSGQVTDIHLSCDYLMAVGEYVELIAGQNSGGNLDILQANPFSPGLWWHLCP